eukprot:13481886-Ditylum_brightwellii.AAC.1
MVNTTWCHGMPMTAGMMRYSLLIFRVLHVFNMGDQVQAQKARSDVWHQATIICVYNNGDCYFISWLYQNYQDKVVRAACVIGIDPSMDLLSRYCDGLGMGHNENFGAGEPR